MQPNNRFAGPPGMQAGNYHHRNPYAQQPNANAANVNPNIVDGTNPHLNGDAASPNAINVDLYGNDELQQQQPVGFISVELIVVLYIYIYI